MIQIKHYHFMCSVLNNNDEKTLPFCCLGFIFRLLMYLHDSNSANRHIFHLTVIHTHTFCLGALNVTQPSMPSISTNNLLWTSLASVLRLPTPGDHIPASGQTQRLWYSFYVSFIFEGTVQEQLYKSNKIKRVCRPAGGSDLIHTHTHTQNPSRVIIG